jgi:hypothetical protein
VIGSNCVVTTDVGPYEIHGGVPNRRIGHRLHFDPPTAISAVNDKSLPYFYRGFRLSQDQLQRSRQKGVVEAYSDATVVVADTNGGELVLTGVQLANRGEVMMNLHINGIDSGAQCLAPGPFEIRQIVPVRHPNASPSRSVSNSLNRFTVVDIKCRPRAEATDRILYGISTASLVRP